MVDLPSSVRGLFVSAGWKASGVVTGYPCTAVEFARQLISEFAGLQVGRVGPGRDLAASDIHFYSHLRAEVSVVGEPWLSGLGKLSGIATAHHDHIIVFVGAGGQCYAFTDPDEQMYLIGGTFGEAMERLLFGFDYGFPIPKDA